MTISPLVRGELPHAACFRSTPRLENPLAGSRRRTTAPRKSERGRGRGTSDAEDPGCRAAAADARGLHRLLHHPQRQGPQHRPTQPDHLHARVRQVPPNTEAGDSGLAQVGGAHAPAPLHGPAQRHRAAAERRPGRRRRALGGRGHARHRRPRLARVPRRLPPLRPCRGYVVGRRRRCGRRNPRAHLHHPSRLREAHLPAEPAQRLVALAPCPAGRGQEEAFRDGQGGSGDSEEAAARDGAAHGPVPRDGHLRLATPRPKLCICSTGRLPATWHRHLLDFCF